MKKEFFFGPLSPTPPPEGEGVCLADAISSVFASQAFYGRMVPMVSEVPADVVPQPCEAFHESLVREYPYLMAAKGPTGDAFFLFYGELLSFLNARQDVGTHNWKQEFAEFCAQRQSYNAALQFLMAMVSVQSLVWAVRDVLTQFFADRERMNGVPLCVPSILEDSGFRVLRGAGDGI